jgi:hypothetical protein
LPDLRRQLELAGYSLSTDTPRAEDIFVASRATIQLQRHSEKDGPTLLISSNAGNYAIGDRKYTVEELDEEAMGHYYIVDKEAFASLPIENPMNWTYYKIIPRRVVRDISETDEGEIMMAGYFDGWVNANSATLFRIAKHPRTVLTTFDFEREYGIDPVTTIILDNLLELLTMSKK